MMPLQLAAAVVFPIKFFHPWNIVFKLNEKKKHFTCLPRLITRNTLQFEGNVISKSSQSLSFDLGLSAKGDHLNLAYRPRHIMANQTASNDHHICDWCANK